MVLNLEAIDVFPAGQKFAKTTPITSNLTFPATLVRNVSIEDCCPTFTHLIFLQTLTTSLFRQEPSAHYLEYHQLNFNHAHNLKIIFDINREVEAHQFKNEIL